MEQNQDSILQDYDRRKIRRVSSVREILSAMLLVCMLAMPLAGCQASGSPLETVGSLESMVSGDLTAMPEITGEALIPPDFALSDLKNTDVFARGALEHIFEGSVNPLGVASGFHYAGISSAGGSIVPGTATATDANGAYEARIMVDGVNKTGNGGYSSFFPSSWTPQDVVDAIVEAYGSKEFVTGDTWRGKGRKVSILMYVDEENHIISAFPEYKGR